MPDDMDDVAFGMLRRHIGRRFEALRIQKGLTRLVAAKTLDRAPTTLARIEDGDEQVRFRVLDVQAMLDLYEAPEDERVRLLALTAETRNGKRKSWWHDYTETDLPPWFSLYVLLEDGAEDIRLFELELVPGLFQTRDYATQIMRVPRGLLDEAESRRRVDVRMERQSLLTRARAPRVDVVLTEAAITRVIGMGPQLAREQLQRLVDVTAQANVALRVVPGSVGVHGGMASSSGFALLNFPTDSRTGKLIEPNTAYLDTVTGAMYLQKPAEVSVYELIWEDLLTRALDPEASRKMITTAMEGIQ